MAVPYLAAAVVLGAMAVAVVLTLGALEDDVRLQRASALEAVLSTTHEALHRWAAMHREMAHAIALDPEVGRLTDSLLALPRDAKILRASPELAALRKRMLPIVKSYRYTGFRLIAADEFVVAARHPKGVGADPPLGKHQAFLRRALSGEILLTPPFAFRHPKFGGAPRPAMFSLAPILGSDGAVKAVLALHLEPTIDFNAMAGLARIGDTGESYAFDREGRLLNASRYETTLRAAGELEKDVSSVFTVRIADPGFDITSMPSASPVPRGRRPLTRAVASAVAGEAGHDLAGHRDYRGVPVVASWLWDPDLGLGLVAQQDLAEAFGAYTLTRNSLYGALALTAGLGLWLTGVLARRRRAALAWAAREREGRARVEQMLADLEHSEERLRLLLESTGEGIYGVDPTGLCTFANPACARMLGYARPEELVGRDIHSLVHHTRPDGTPYPADSCPTRQACRTGESTMVEDEVFWRPDGSRFAVSYRSHPIRRGTEVVGAVVAFTDITERKRGEQALEERTEDLTRSNQDLEQFAYVASHDLQEPLRMVTSYLQLLERAHGEKLDGDAREYVHFAVDGAKRMSGLIKDLLAYSRVTTQGKPFLPVDLNEVASRAVSNLQGRIVDAEAEVVVGDLPLVMGDEGQLTSLFQNLIGNALKYSAPDRPPRVEVTASEAEAGTPGGDGWSVSVSDNGIGIAPQYQDRIFVIFQRLHQRHEYEGTGIGLAVCKKIVERHGGRIDVDSDPGRGSTFRFSLPADGKPRGAE